MAETATVEAPAVPAEVEAPATTLATEEAPASSSEEQQAPAEGTPEVKEPTLLEVASDPELLRKAIEAGVKPEEIHRAIREQETPDAAEEIRREAQRIREQEREAEAAVKDRTEAFTATDQTGRRNARWLLDQIAQADTDPDAVATVLAEKITSSDGSQRSKFSLALDSVYSGAIASVSLDTERAVTEVLDGDHKAAIDALPDEKKAELKRARYELATKGNLRPLLKIAFEAVATHKAAEAEAKGEVKGEKKAEATKANLELVKKLRDAGVLGAPRVLGGRPRNMADERSALERELRSIDVTTPDGRAEFDRRQPEFRQRIAAIT